MPGLLPTTDPDEGGSVTTLDASPVSAPLARRRSALVRLGTSALIGALMVAFVAGVATNSLPPLPSPGPAQPPRGGSVVEAILSDTDSLIPQLSTEGYDGAVDAAIWAPLWYGDAAGMLHPGLASEVPSIDNGGISPDLKTWTIHLKPNLKWSDGSPLTVADVAFSLNTFADPRVGDVNFWHHDPNDPIDFLGAKIVDSATVQFSLAHPYVEMNAFLADGFNSPIPQEVFGNMAPGDIGASHEAFFPTVSSGPFKMSEHVQGDHLTVVRNPYYYQGPDKPYLDQITFRPFPTANDVVKAAQAGQLDAAYGTWSNITPELFDSYHALAGYTTYLDQYPTGYELAVFNLTNPILADKVVRQALTMSLDPKQIAALAKPGLLAPVCDDHAGNFAHEPGLTCYKQDPAKARQLLDADGWTLGADGLRHKDGKTLELTYSTANIEVNPQRAGTENLVVKSWARIGVKIDIKNYFNNAFFRDVLPNGGFDIAEYGSSTSYDPDDSSLFMCNLTPDKGGSNYMRYCNPTVDQEEQAQLGTPDQAVLARLSPADQAKRLGDFHAIDSIILNDLPVMYYYAEANLGIYRSTLHNYKPFPQGFDLWNCWEWYLAPR